VSAVVLPQRISFNAPSPSVPRCDGCGEPILVRTIRKWGEAGPGETISFCRIHGLDFKVRNPVIRVPDLNESGLAARRGYAQATSDTSPRLFQPRPLKARVCAECGILFVGSRRAFADHKSGHRPWRSPATRQIRGASG
jgi:hypothetical protein